MRDDLKNQAAPLRLFSMYVLLGLGLPVLRVLCNNFQGALEYLCLRFWLRVYLLDYAMVYMPVLDAGREL